jgi:hypothetical protein
VNAPLGLKEYCEEKLLSENSLREYLNLSAIVSVELDEGVVHDLLVLLPDEVFEGRFKPKFGECFVQNDQKSSPPVFTRFKSHSWLRRDFARRLPIALWIFRKSVVMQDPGGNFGTILREHNTLFEQDLENIIKRKYIELRSDRHNLRQTISRGDRLASDLLKANVVKLALELLMLSHGKPYPYKKWLAIETGRFTSGQHLLDISSRFIETREPKDIISLSDELVGLVIKLLESGTQLPPTLLKEWWLHLS